MLLLLLLIPCPITALVFSFLHASRPPQHIRPRWIALSRTHISSGNHIPLKILGQNQPSDFCRIFVADSLLPPQFTPAVNFTTAAALETRPGSSFIASTTRRGKKGRSRCVLANTIGLGCLLVPWGKWKSRPRECYQQMDWPQTIKPIEGAITLFAYTVHSIQTRRDEGKEYTRGCI